MQPDTLSGSYEYSRLKILKYGPGCLSTALPDVIKQLGVKKAMILTGSSISKSPLLKQVESAIGPEVYGGFNAGIGQHAPIDGINAALTQVQEIGADAIVAVGGGSPIDSAKIISNWRNEKTNSGFLTIIAIPTTLSAAEMTAVAGYTNEQGQKVGLGNLEIAPKAIILDAEVTFHTPQTLWLSSGIRALDHAVEALYSPTPPRYTIVNNALPSIPTLFEYLLKCKASPEDVQVRQTLQLAAFHSMFPNVTPDAIGLSHVLGHALGATYSIPHGITSCITLAGSVALIAKHSTPGNLARLAQALRFLRVAESLGLEPTKRFVESAGEEKNDGVMFAGYIDALVDQLGLKNRLQDWKVPKEDFEKIVGPAEQRKFVGDQEGKPSKGDVLKMLEAVY